MRLLKGFRCSERTADSNSLAKTASTNMRILKRDISAKDGAGSVKLRAEEAEDMWHTYHLVAPGDRIRTSTLRKVVKEGSTGSVTSAKVKLTLTLSVKRVEFDAESCTLHVCGPNVEESEHVRLGAFHTIHLELNRDFTIEKVQKAAK